VRDVLIAVPFGLAIGILLGLVGAGGSILAVPVLVYVLGEPVKQATTESLLIVGVTALVGALGAARTGRVQWRTGLAFAAAGALAAIAGTALNRLVGPTAILTGFGVLLLVGAYGMARPPRPRAAPVGRPPGPLVAAAGAVTGLLTGFFGVGGGFVIVPSLTLALGLPMTIAVGTSLLVSAITSAAALGAHLATGGIAFGLAAGFAAASVTGAVLGTHLHVRLPETLLRRLFAALLVAVGLFVLAKSVY
jgi:uncharacterized membrane protein YfcA